MVIIDCSIAVNWTLNDEHSDYAAIVLAYFTDNKPELFVPPLFTLEVLNALQMAFKRKRISKEELAKTRRYWLKHPVHVCGLNYDRIIELVDKHQLTPYDAAYLDVAISKQTPLATLDKSLMFAAKKEKVAFAG